jgi:hypothetical protein
MPSPLSAREPHPRATSGLPESSGNMNLSCRPAANGFRKSGRRKFRHGSKRVRSEVGPCGDPEARQVPRDSSRAANKNTAWREAGRCLCDIERRDLDALCFSPLGRPGNDLLSRVLRRSTIGAGAFHGRVRNGIGCSHPAIITRSAKG